MIFKCLKITLILAIIIFLPRISMAIEKKAIFAGGCFWCMEEAFDKLEGVKNVISGYTGGDLKNPSYEEVTRGNTGHYEAIEVTYDSEKIQYSQLLDFFWQNIDPFNNRGQFCDLGSSYLSAIFFKNDEEKKEISKSKNRLKINTGNIQTHILPFKEFYRAEEYHQNFYQKNPDHYKAYKSGCGREKRLNQVWNTLKDK